MTTLRANVVVQNRDIGTQFGDLQFQPSRDRGLPMNDLPFEILSKIFIHCLPENPLSVLQPNCKIAPSLLCRVCTLWRDVASKTPQLWTDFHFSLPDTQDRRLLGPNHKRPPGLNLQFSKFFDGWTQNMGASPPSFHIRVFNNSGKFNRVGRYRSFEDLFASTSLRASRFLELTSLPLRMICDSQAPFQYLEALSLSGSGVGNNYNKSIFPPTPALRRISLGLDVRFPEIIKLFPWAQLTHLSAASLCAQYSPGLSHWPSLLKACVNLQYGVFHLEDLDSRHLNRPKQVMPNMRHMVIYLATRKHFSHIPTSYIPTVFASLSFPSLTALRIIAEELALKSLHDILIATPAVTELHLCRCVIFETSRSYPLPIENASVPSLRPLSEYVPRLKVLVLDQVRVPPNEYNGYPTIVHFLRSKFLCAGWSPPSPRPRVEIIFEWMTTRELPAYYKAVTAIGDYLESDRHGGAFEVLVRHRQSPFRVQVFEPGEARDEWDKKMKLYDSGFEE